MHDLTAFQRDLLYVLTGIGPEKGLATKDELETYYEGEINHGRLYPNLDQLVEMGLISKGEIDQRTNSYKLTRRGVHELKVRREWEEQYLDERFEVSDVTLEAERSDAADGSASA